MLSFAISLLSLLLSRGASEPSHRRKARYGLPRPWRGPIGSRARPGLEALEDRCLLSAGALDPTFGSGGMVSASGIIAPDAVVVQPADGKIVIASETGLTRFNPNGSVDTSFGPGGTVTQSGISYGLAIDAHGKIVAVGDAYLPNTSDQAFEVIRYNTDGSLDSTFGSGGIVLTNVNPRIGKYKGTITDLGREFATAVVIQGDGKIDVSGFVAVTTGATAQFTLLRYNTDGTLDSSFGNQSPKNGITITPPFAGGSDFALALALQSDGNILVAGTAGWTTTHRSMAVARYLGAGAGAGQLDSSFGTGGIVTMAAPGSGGSSAYGVLVQSSQNNAIVVSGYSTFASSVLTLARLTNGGQLDATFGGSGTGFAINSSITEPPPNTGLGIVLHPNGDLLTVGTATTSQLAVAAYLPNGTPDTTFGTGGITTASFSGGSSGFVMAIQPSDGKIVAAGSTGSNNSALALARFLPPDTKIGSFTANPNPVSAGSSVTLTASNITDANPSSTIARVAFYLNGTLLGTGTQTSPGVWTFTFTVSLAPGSYMLTAQATDSFGALGDPVALTLTVQ